MAIRIQTEKTEIPIELGELRFAFSVSDESVKEFSKNAESVQKELERLAARPDDEKGLELAKEALKKGYDAMFGEGTFEKVYELSPSVLIVMKYFQQIAEGIHEELGKMGFGETQQQKAKKYIRNKKKK